MNQWVIDTNVMVVANGRHDQESRPVSPSCRKASIKFLKEFLDGENCVLVDYDFKVLQEYQRYLNPCGQPGVGDRFLQELNLNDARIQRVNLPIGADGQYCDLHADIMASDFDQNDRKFVALALQQNAPVANSVDGDWIEHLTLLTNCGVTVNLLCGPDRTRWYENTPV